MELPRHALKSYTYLATTDLGPGQLVTTTIRFFREHWKIIFTLCFLFNLPMNMVTEYFFPAPLGDGATLSDIKNSQAIPSIYEFFISSFFMLCILHLVKRKVKGESVDLRSCLGGAATTYPKFIVGSVVLVLGIILVTVPFVTLGSALIAAKSGLATLSLVGIIILWCILMGLVLFFYGWYPQLLVWKAISPRDAFRQSTEITKSRFWMIVGYGALLSLIFFAAAMALLTILSLLFFIIPEFWLTDAILETLTVDFLGSTVTILAMLWFINLQARMPAHTHTVALVDPNAVPVQSLSKLPATATKPFQKKKKV